MPASRIAFSVSQECPCISNYVGVQSASVLKLLLCRHHNQQELTIEKMMHCKSSSVLLQQAQIQFQTDFSMNGLQQNMDAEA